MRTLHTPVVLLALVLALWLTQAAAQDARAMAQTTPASDNLEQLGASPDQSPGIIRQPSIEFPGVTTGIKLGELYTDNLKLVDDDTAKENGWITVIKPFVKAAHDGPRLSGVFDARLAGYLYAQHADYNQLAAHLNTHGTLAVVRDHLFLDGAATYGRAVINNQLPAGSGSFFLSNNRANVATVMLSPYWVQKLGHVATMTLRYTRGRVMYNRNGITETRGNPLAGISNIRSYGLNFSVVSSADQTWGWALWYAGKRIKSDNGLSLHFATAVAKLSRALGVHGRVLVKAGKENRYWPDGHVDTLGARFWAVGYSWSDPHNTFKLTGGHRFYGHSAQLSWTHEASRLTTYVMYDERPTDLNQQLMGKNTGVGLNVPSGVSGIPSLFEHRIYLMKRATASAAYLMPKGKLSLTLFNESRDYFLRGHGHETVSDAHLAWRVDLGPFTTLTPTLGWRRYRFADNQVNETRYVQLELLHTMSPRDSINLRLRHESRSAHAVAAGALGYEANVIYLYWTHLF